MKDMWDKLEELFDCGVPKDEPQFVTYEIPEIIKVVLNGWKK